MLLGRLVIGNALSAQNATITTAGLHNVTADSTLAAYGDAPYGTTPTDTSETLATPAFIANVNADPDVSLVVHVGDIHSTIPIADCRSRDRRSHFSPGIFVTRPSLLTPAALI